METAAPNNLELGAAIAAARQEAKLSQVEVARLLGVDKRTLSAYERGTRRIHGTTLLRLAGILNWSLDRLLGLQFPLIDGRTRQAFLLRKLAEMAEFSEEDQKIVLGMIESIKGKYKG